MTVNEFIIEEINRRAEAAKVLSDDIKINDIYICGGCFTDGIRLWSGIDQIATLTRAKIDECEEINNGHRRLIRSININGTTFYQEIYCKDGEAE